MTEYKTAVALAAPPSEVFDFLTRPADVMDVTDPSAGITLLSGPEVMAAGTANELEVRGYGPTQRVTYTVTAFEPPAGPEDGGRFVEEMTAGPLKRFIQEHLFRPLPGGGCEAADVVDFKAPGGLLGFVVTESMIRGQLEKSFAYRHRKLVEKFGAA